MKILPADKPPGGNYNIMDTVSLDALCKQLCAENLRYIRRAAECRLTDKSLVNGVIKATFLEATQNIRDLQADPDPQVWFLNTALGIINRCNNSQRGDSDA
jgi:hypothetical protein